MGFTARSEYNDYRRHTTLCAQCGYAFAKGDEAYYVKATGDLIHRDCFMDYTDDNIDEFTDTIEF